MGHSSGLRPFETQIPARLDRLPWSRFHLLIILALGITWILDGLEVTLTAAISGVLQEAETLHFTAAELGLTGSAYLIAAVSGALVFGYVTDPSDGRSSSLLPSRFISPGRC